jgi:hypothetical protein
LPYRALSSGWYPFDDRFFACCKPELEQVAMWPSTRASSRPGPCTLNVIQPPPKAFSNLNSFSTTVYIWCRIYTCVIMAIRDPMRISVALGSD